MYHQLRELFSFSTMSIYLAKSFCFWAIMSLSFYGFCHFLNCFYISGLMVKMLITRFLDYPQLKALFSFSTMSMYLAKSFCFWAILSFNFSGSWNCLYVSGLMGRILLTCSLARTNSLYHSDNLPALISSENINKKLKKNVQWNWKS